MKEDDLENKPKDIIETIENRDEFIEEWADFAIAMLILVAAIAIAQII